MVRLPLPYSKLLGFSHRTLLAEWEKPPSFKPVAGTTKIHRACERRTGHDRRNAPKGRCHGRRDFASWSSTRPQFSTRSAREPVLSELYAMRARTPSHSGGTWPCAHPSRGRCVLYRDLEEKLKEPARNSFRGLRLIA